MVEVALLVLLGFFVGGFGTLVGAGGGFILVPILLFIYPDTSPEAVTAMSLFAVMGNAASGTIAYGLQRRIDVRSGLLFALATLPGAVAGAWFVRFISRATFDILFAVVLGSVGAYLLVRRAGVAVRAPLRGRGLVRRRITDRAGNRFVYSFKMWQGMAISSVVGFVSSLFGIGGGIVHVPMMAIVLHFPVHIATATSQFVLVLMAAEATSVHLASGTLGWNETLLRAGAITAGAVVGAQVGARLSSRVHGDHIVRALGGALVLVSLRLALSQL
ncbi:MAG: sulfite exporter TauE/SafE family protein [Chloroflexi bacterium]|nr:sulfite exporter TauE/SafE family protein [Chloroflexota bacterium]MDA1004374.1 sulfite exporter TauE/SafE family protein [Chloroflexota bacterium]